MSRSGGPPRGGCLGTIVALLLCVGFWYLVIWWLAR